MAHHSSVNYIEPNLISNGADGLPWKVKDDYERAPRLEDYSIVLNLEVEVCSRNNISQSTKSSSEVLILSYSTSGDKSTVNFMGGTKVQTGNYHYRPMPYLTTNYADMYVGDLVNYGTTEMIGVKSVEIEYQKNCVPIINITFTDVRGLSLFQPTELSRTNEYQGIGGINADNVAQSFFQCFFKLPMPKFTITIKGFYGMPVTYEVMCDKFDTKFNSNTGDFDITTRFIGYSYSFLTDISIDALFAAPYSDFEGGKDYWEKMKQDDSENGFTIWNKEKTVKRPMPTLFEIWQEMKSLLSESTSAETSLTYEEHHHDLEISELQEILDKSRSWYNSLFELCCARYGKEYCYLFKEDGDEGEPYRIIVLTNNSTNGRSSMYNDYKEFPDTFKQETQNLHSLIVAYNTKEKKFKDLENVSLDFSDYERQRLFNNCFVNGNNDIVFNGFSKTCRLPKTQVTKHVFYGVKYTGYDNEDIRNKEIQHKKHVLGVIYGNGVDQYVNCFHVSYDYRSIRDRINALQADANKNLKEKEHEKRIKEINKQMFEKMSWYPTVENFTRIMVAHLETLMNMMYNVVNKCKGRTASELGVSVGDGGNVNDVRSGVSEIPPFPKVTNHVVGDDGITTMQDAWVGEYNGATAFAEVDFIDGLFNAAERLEALYKDQQTAEAERNKESAQGTQEAPVIKHPLSSFDLYMTQSPYGDSNDISNDTKGFDFAAKVGIRMFNILGLSNFRRDFNNKQSTNGDLIKSIARTEADNFYSLVRLSNGNFITMLRDGVITSEKVMEILTTVHKQDEANPCPWGTKTSLFKNSENEMRINYTERLFPIQGFTIPKVIEYHSAYQSGVVGDYNGTMAIKEFPSGFNGGLPNDRYGLGNVAIIDDFASVSKYIDGGNSFGASDDYSEYYQMIQSACTFDDEAYKKFIQWDSSKIQNDPPSICNTIYNYESINPTSFVNDNGKMSLVGKDGSTGASRSYNIANVENFPSNAKDGTLKDYTILEMFSYSASEGTLRPNSSVKYRPNIQINKDADGRTLDTTRVQLTNMIMGVKLNTTEISNYLLQRRTVNYIPRLAALQIGAIIYQAGGFKCGSNVISSAREKVAVRAYNNKMISDLNECAKMAYEKYYLDWIDSHTSFVDLMKDDKYYIFPKKEIFNTERRILRQDNELVREFTCELLSPVCVVNTSIFHDKAYANNPSKYSMNKGKAQVYLDGFIERLKELYKINYTEDSNGNLIKTTDEPRKTTKDMKIELYRYMKQIYDKWIPMSSFNDWRLPSFFPSGRDGEENGHKFYFIDSYYNDVSHKLLVNPKVISEKVEALLSYKDINSMMLGFMSDIYNSNKAMLMSIQNFADLKKDGCMNEMFTPMSFNSIAWEKVNKYPSFVVVYPYSPSRNLAVDNSEYKDDSFMLNDEFETPTAIRSKTDGQMKIPAFGVSYGKQYQSYFKSININMQSPVQTEQSIKAKHFIIREHANTNNKGVVAQDLYDVYSTQSYTCEVEMIGCAWVQPLMYFVLLNVPMFKGSYMIMKVKHSIKPGDMTTRFTGCRMANTSTKMIEDIFTDEDALIDADSYSGYESDYTERADIDNDCPYRVYPLYPSTDAGDLKAMILKAEGGYTEKLKDGHACTNKGVTITKFREFYGKNKTCNDLRNITDAQWDEIFKTGYWDAWQADDIVNKSIANLLVDWCYNSGNNGILYAQDALGVSRGTSKSAVATAVQKINAVTNQEALFNTLWQARKKYYQDIAKGDKAQYLKGWLNRLSEFHYAENPSSSGKQEKDVNVALFDALNRTCQDTPSIGIKIKYLGAKGGYHRINQENGKTDKLHLVFDALLNSDYNKYVKELGWIYPNGGLQQDVAPDVIYYIASQTVRDNEKVVWTSQYGAKTKSDIGNEIPEGNGLLLKSLAKRKATIGKKETFMKEVPQVRDTTILDKYAPQNCASLFNSGGGKGITYNPSDTDPNDDGYIEGWNVGAACQYAIKDSPTVGVYDGYCATHVLQAIYEGVKRGHDCKMPKNDRIHTGGGGQATLLRYKGILEKYGFVKIGEGEIGNNGTPNMNFQSGDIAIIGKSDLKAKYHAAIFTSKGWLCGTQQKGMSCYKDTYPYAVYRYKNKKKSRENYGF